MEDYPISLTVSPGRSGTRFLYSTFLENFSDKGYVSHELLHPNVAKPAVFHRGYDKSTQIEMLRDPRILDLTRFWLQQAKQGPVVDFGFTMSSLIPAFYEKFGEQLRILVLHRHPISVAASFAIRGHYTQDKSPAWAISPMHARVLYPQFKKHWDSLSRFEKCLFRWLEVTMYGLELSNIFPDVPYLIMPSDRIFKSDEALREVADFLGFPTTQQIKRSQDKNISEIQYLERWPVESEWRGYKKFPELIELAERLGYNMEENYVAEIIRRYQLPSGALPYLRHKLGYWPLRFHIGYLRRRLGFR